MRPALALLLIGCGHHGGGAAGDAAGDGVPGDTAGVHDADDGGTYAAYAIIGNLSRVRIAKTRGTTCFELQLVNPSTATGGLMLPSMWGVELAAAMQPAAACDPAYAGPVQNMFGASSQSGSVAFTTPAFGGPPQTIDTIDVTLVFANAPAWCPSSEGLLASAIHAQ